MASPLGSLRAARDQIRAMNPQERARGPVTVLLRGGEYLVEETFALGREDSGSSEAPVTYTAYRQEKVTLTAGKRLDLAAAQIVTDNNVLRRVPPEARGLIYALDVKKQGVESLDALESPPEEYWISSPSGVQLYWDGRLMKRARWPNSGYVFYGEVVESSGVRDHKKRMVSGAAFVYTDPRPGRWTGARDAWLSGYWNVDWFMETLQIKSVDVPKKVISTVNGHMYPVLPERRFYAYNLLEELDLPGEYYLDRDGMMLYFIPPGNLSEATLVINARKHDLVSIAGAAHLSFKALTLAHTRSHAFLVKDSDDILIEGCEMRELGEQAVVAKGGHRNIIRNNLIQETGYGGVWVEGGDRNTLSPAGHSIDNNVIYRYQVDRTGRGFAARLAGVGCTLSHNVIYDGQGIAVWFEGNEHSIESNEIHTVCLDELDTGPVYTGGRQWSDRGNRLRHNYIHDSRSNVVERKQGTDHSGESVAVNGIYIDDLASGVTSVGNVISNVSRAFLVGGGHHNRFSNNIIIDCLAGGVVDDRGLSWSKHLTVEGGEARVKLAKVPYREEPWKSNYPELVSLLDQDPAIPRGNELTGNLYVQTPFYKIAHGAVAETKLNGNWRTSRDPGFVDLEGADFRLKEDAEVFQRIPGFQPIPFDRIGIQEGPSGVERPKPGRFDLLYPADGTKDVHPGVLTLAWSTCPFCEWYTVEVARDADFQDLVFTASTHETNVKVTGLGADRGSYHWRVTALSRSRQWRAEVPCNRPYRFTTDVKPAASKP